MWPVRAQSENGGGQRCIQKPEVLRKVLASLSGGTGVIVSAPTKDEQVYDRG